MAEPKIMATAAAVARLKSSRTRQKGGAASHGPVHRRQTAQGNGDPEPDVKLARMLPTMDDAGLKTLRANAERLLAGGDFKQQFEAGDLLPLIGAEMKRRQAAKPIKAAKAPHLPATGVS